MSKKPNGYWTYDRCKEEALKYTEKNLFQKERSSTYNTIYKNKWFELFDNFKLQGNRYKRLVYVFEFSDNYFYVGLTGNIKRREKQHLNNDKNSSVYKHIIETNIIPKLILISDYIDIEESIRLEKLTLEMYIKNKWVQLNKVKTGGIGSNNLKWTKDKCREEALKYETISNYQKLSKSSYNAALKCNWIDDICLHMKRKKSKNGYWNNKELCKNESMKYKNKTELHKNNWSVYYYSKRNGWLNEFFKI